MSASSALRLACEHGLHVTLDGAELVLDAEREPPEEVLEVIRRDKSKIIVLLLHQQDEWSLEDWRVFHDERAAIREHDGGMSQAEAEQRALEDCVVEWVNRHPEPSKPGFCAWCGAPETNGPATIPFGSSAHGHRWLHAGCWTSWSDDRRNSAREALEAFGLSERPD